MADLSDDELQREFARRKRIVAWGYGITFLLIVLGLPITWALVDGDARHRGLVWMGVNAGLIVVYAIVRLRVWRCPACGFEFPTWDRRRINEYFGRGVACGGCKRRLAA